MAKLKPQKFLDLTLASKVGTVCDCIGMTELPGVDQLASGLGALAYTVAGQPIDAALSAASIVPGAGKVADATKLARNAKKVTNGVSAAQKEAKLLKQTKRNAGDMAEVAKQSEKKSSTQAKTIQPQPSKTQAKSAKKQSEKEIKDDTHHFDSYEYFGLKDRKLEGAISPNNQSANFQSNISTQKRNFINTYSSPQTNNVFSQTGKPIILNLGI